MTTEPTDGTATPPIGGRRTMDRHIEQLTENLDRLDRLLRGNGTPGLVAGWYHAKREIEAHAAQLATLASMPRDLGELKRALEDAAARTAELAEKVDGLVASAERARALKEGETQAVTKAGTWLKATAAALAVIGLAGSVGLVAALERLGQLAEALR